MFYEIWQTGKFVCYLSKDLEVTSSGSGCRHMIKRIFSLLFLATVWSKMTSGQVIIALLFGEKLNTGKLEFGLVATPQLTGISNIISERRNGLNLGIYFNIRPDKRFFIHAEGIAKGAFGAEKIIPYPTGSDTLEQLFSAGTVERKIKVFSMPVLCRYAITQKFFADLGLQPNMMLNAKDFFRSEINGSDLEYTVKVTDEVTRLDFGFAGGLHYKFRKDKRSMGLSIRYYQGLTDILKETAGKQVNSAWQFVISIPVGVGKSEVNGEKASN